jgi:ParB family chromosome partitioning protein
MMTARRPGLGRGLDALLEVESAPRPTTLAIDALHPNKYQPRTNFDSPALAELVESIRSQGIVQPIVVTPRPAGGFTIVAGERRWRAARQAGLAEVPVVVREVEGGGKLLEMALVENLQRTDLNSIEEAEAFERLRSEFALSHQEIARRVGKSRSSVSNALRLLTLAPEVQALVRDGELTAGHVRPLLALDDADDQVRWARQAVKGRWSVRRMEAIGTAPGSARRGEPQSRAVDPDTRAAEEALTRKLQTRVEIRRSRRGGRLVLAFYSEDELIRLYDILMDTKDRGR